MDFHDIGFGVGFFVFFGLFFLFKRERLMNSWETFNSYSSMQIRGQGILLIFLGIIMLAITQYMIRTYGTYLRRVAYAGPCLCILGLATVIIGKPDGFFKRILFFVSLAFGVGIGIVYSEELKSYKPSVVVDTVNSFSESLHLKEHPVTQQEIDAAVAEVKQQSEELNQRRKTIDKNDPQAVQQLNKDIQAYTVKNHEVKAMVEKYNAIINANAALTKQLIGKWKSIYDYHDGFVDTTVSTYSSNGHWSAFISQKQKSRTVDVTLEGKWIVAGHTLVIYKETSTDPQVKEAGGEDQFAIKAITDNELTLLNSDGETITKTRIE